MNNDISLLDDGELEAASGGTNNTGMDGISAMDSTASEASLGRVRTSDKQTKAITAFIKS